MQFQTQGSNNENDAYNNQTLIYTKNIYREMSGVSYIAPHPERSCPAARRCQWRDTTSELGLSLWRLGAKRAPGITSCPEFLAPYLSLL